MSTDIGAEVPAMANEELSLKGFFIELMEREQG